MRKLRKGVRHMAQNTQSIVPVNEDKEVIDAKIEVAKKYYLTPKYSMWEELFFDKKNRETFGNATVCAGIAYDLDLKDPKAYNVASVMGSNNLRKVKDLRKRYWNERGLTPTKLLDLYNKMMIERKDVNLLYSVADDMGVELPEYKQVVGPKIANQNNTQINGSDIQINFSSTENK